MAEALVEGRDYYVENGLWVFTAAYLRRRGYCCRSGCRHCPYGFQKPPPQGKSEIRNSKSETNSKPEIPNPKRQAGGF